MADESWSGWHILGLVIGGVTAFELFFSNYEATSYFATSCGNGYRVLTESGGACDDQRGFVLLRVLVGAGLAWAAWWKGDQVTRSEPKPTPPAPKPTPPAPKPVSHSEQVRLALPVSRLLTRCSKNFPTGSIYFEEDKTRASAADFRLLSVDSDSHLYAHAVIAVRGSALDATRRHASWFIVEDREQADYVVWWVDEKALADYFVFLVRG